MRIRMGPDQKHLLDLATKALGQAFKIESQDDTPARKGEGYLRYIEATERDGFHPLLNEE